jgi:hypothetical protein
MAAAKDLLPSMFSNAAVYTDDKAPGYWNTINPYSDNQAAIFIAKRFNAEEYELDRLLDFAREGNHVFIIAKSFSYETQSTFNFSYSQIFGEEVLDNQVDSLTVGLDPEIFDATTAYSFPGKKYESWFTSYDTLHTVVLGRNKQGQANFIKMKIGSGSILIHSAPIVFSNYFILHKNNIRYFQKVFSAIPDNVEKLVWDEYYLTRKPSSKSKEDKPKGIFSVLFRYPSFKWGMLTAIVILLLYILFNMRRRQRMIPAYSRPKNDSLDFVKTMGRLYHDKRDHKNLCQKMAVYFLEHVRSQYKLPTHTLDEKFEKLLHYKSGYSEEGIHQLVSFIRYLQVEPDVTEQQLSKFYTQLESFYQNT